VPRSAPAGAPAARFLLSGRQWKLEIHASVDDRAVSGLTSFR
jgi:hypothetical protein